MNRQSLNYNYGLNFQAVWLILGTLFLGLFLGLFSVLMPWYIGLGLVILPALLVFSAIRPQIGVILILMLIFEVVPTEFQPKLPIGGGGLTIPDLFILYLAGILGLRALWQGEHPIKEIGAVRWPMYYLYAGVASSLFYVKYFAPNTIAMAEARVQIAWLIIPLIVLSFASLKSFRTLLNWTMVIAAIISIYVVVQSLLGIQIIGTAEEMAGTLNEEVIRVHSGAGIYLVFFTLYLLLSRCTDGRLSVIKAFPMLTLLLVCIALTFGRGIWMASALGLLLSAFLHRGLAGLVKTALIGGFFVALMLSALYVVRPATTMAIVDRATGIGKEVEKGGSFGWRKQENHYAWIAIKKHPFTGVGLGGQYKQTISAAGHFEGETSYIHNGYLNFPLKMGLWTSFIPLAFIVAFILTLLQAVRREQASSGRVDRSFIGALCGAFLVPVITAYTQSEWQHPGGIAAFSVFFGLALLYRRYGSPYRDDKLLVRVQ